MSTHLRLEDTAVRQAIDSLVGLDLIPPIDKAHLLLVANGDKPAMHTGFFSHSVELTQEIEHVNEADVEKLLHIIANLGLVCRIDREVFSLTDEGKKTHNELAIFYVAKTIDMATDLAQARKNKDARKEGLLLGFPETAIEAYVTGSVLAVSEWTLLEAHIPADNIKFLNHMLSRSNWQEEVSYLSDYVDATKRLSPTIYRQCVTD